MKYKHYMNMPQCYVLYGFDCSCWLSQVLSVVARGQTGARDCLAQMFCQCLRHLLSTSSYPVYLSPGEYGTGAISLTVKCFSDLMCSLGDLFPRLAVESHHHANQ